MREIQHKVMDLNASGYYIGPRDPDRNTAFKGKYMVCATELLEAPPSPDASNGGFCIVGDNLGELIETAHADILGD